MALKNYYKNQKKKRQYSKDYYNNHKKEKLQYSLNYYYDNHEEKINYSKKYYENNKEQKRKQYKEYYNLHKEQRKQYAKQWRLNNLDKVKENQKAWRKNNPNKIFNYNQQRRNKENKQGNGITIEQWIECMKFFNWECAYSGEKLIKGKNRTIDHIIPLNNKGVNEIWNCVPMLYSYNSSKQDEEMLKWYKKQEFYTEERLNKIYEWQRYAYDKWCKEDTVNE